MIRLTDCGVVLHKNWEFKEDREGAGLAGKSRTMTWNVIETHNHSGHMEQLQLKFDALVSPDNNYVNILQTAAASGLKQFPVPYVLSNCHHTLCAVGGTINEDDHVFGLDNAKKYGGIFVPPYRSVLHQYMREMMAGCGMMILGSDSHTRYGALGTMGIGEGGGEVVKQLLGRTYDLPYPPVIAVVLTGIPQPGVGPQDVALALAAEVCRCGFLKNKILEFVGPGIENLSMEYRMGIDVMTTECGALSSIWCTDEKTEAYLREHGRGEKYRPMAPEEGAYYDGLVEVDLSQIECMIALPFHPGNAVPIRELKARLPELLAEVEAEGRRIKGEKGKPFSIMDHIRDGELYVDQALVSGCSGGLFENIVAMADILSGYGISGDGVSLGINPASLPVMADLMAKGIAGELAVCGATLRPAICGPCFGVTDVPADNQLSIRHVTRNYPNREGSKPGQGQMAAVFLMDARSVAATVRNGGRLTAATELSVVYRTLSYHFDKTIYENQVFDRYRKGEIGKTLTMGPNIAPWPRMYPLTNHLLLRAAGVYEGSVTTDELIPSGETSSFRSNPEMLSQYVMINRDKNYVERAREIREQERQRKTGIVEDLSVRRILSAAAQWCGCSLSDITLGSVMISRQIGEGSSREQAASCQKVLGGFANLSNEYATKRYRSNLINWGILPLRTEEELDQSVGEYLLIPDVRNAVKRSQEADGRWIQVLVLDEQDGSVKKQIRCTLDALTADEIQILLAGSLINHYKGQETAGCKEDSRKKFS